MSSDSQPWKMHHTGYVVASIEDVIETFSRSVDGGRLSAVWHDPIQRVSVAFIYPRDRASPCFELVEPDAGESPVRRFLEAGGGMHHVCYEVADIDGECKSAQARGLTLLRRPQPAVAFGGRRIAWLISREKLLIEFLEIPPIQGGLIPVSFQSAR